MKLCLTRTILADSIASIRRRKVFAIFAVSTLAASAVSAEDLPIKLDAILQREAQGEIVDRARALEDDNQSTASDLSKWHAGKVHVGNRWCDVSELNLESAPKRINRYLELREKTAQNLEGHRSLARWCSKEKLELQAKAHWTALCDLFPNDDEARQELGHKSIGGRWVSPEQWNAAEKKMQERVSNYRKWIPKMKNLAMAVQGSDVKARSKAIESVREIKDDSAVQSMAAMAVILETDQARPFVTAIRRFHTKEACLTLAKIAIADPSSIAASEAITGMKEYRPEFYVRDLLGLVEEDIEFTHRFSARPTGELVLEQLWARDTSNEKTVLSIDTVLQAAQRNINTRVAGPSNSTLGNRNGVSGLGWFSLRLDSQNAISPLAKNVSIRTAEANMIRNKELVDQENHRHKADRERVFSVLKSCLGVDQGNSANDWWNWWDRENDSNYIQSRNQNYQYVRDESYAVQPIAVVATPRHECLTAGTLVQTISGLKPIESIRVGDLVLSQNVDTAAIELKPVLKTTVRDPAPIVEIKTSTDTIHATRGHNWWVSGKGWRRTRELEKDWVVHTATGSIRLESIESLEVPEVTYNMIVADNHSYFVGNNRLLSNDATELEPSLLPVPSYRGTVNLVSAVSSASSTKDAKRKDERR